MEKHRTCSKPPTSNVTIWNPTCASMRIVWIILADLEWLFWDSNSVRPSEKDRLTDPCRKWIQADVHILLTSLHEEDASTHLYKHI